MPPAEAMQLYLVEAYFAKPSPSELRRVAVKARAAASELSRGETRVRYLRSLVIPEDEICFHLFEAPSAETVWEASRRAALTPERIVEALQ